MYRFFLPALLSFGIAMMSQETTADELPSAKPLAGWMDVFPQVQGYQLTFQKPLIVSAKPPDYRQTVRYDWTGGRLEAVEITLARNGTFAKMYDADSLASDNPPRALKVGKFAAWQWKNETLVVILAPDRILKVESQTPEGHDSDLVGFARKIPLAKCIQALDQPPRVDFKRRLESFRSLRKGMSLVEVMDWVGDADKDMGFGIHIMVYNLGDGSRVLIGFPNFSGLLYVKHEDKMGNRVDLVK